MNELFLLCNHDYDVSIRCFETFNIVHSLPTFVCFKNKWSFIFFFVKQKGWKLWKETKKWKSSAGRERKILFCLLLHLFWWVIVKTFVNDALWGCLFYIRATENSWSDARIAKGKKLYVWFAVCGCVFIKLKSLLLFRNGKELDCKYKMF